VSNFTGSRKGVFRGLTRDLTRKKSVLVGSQSFSGVATDHHVKNRIQAAIDREVKSGPVVFKDGGGTANLSCADTQRRSVAALLAKKYQDRSMSLRGIATRMRRKELTEAEINTIHHEVERIKRRLKL